ncbi:MAG: acyl-CoA dehydrogenase [Rhodospirillales bacterium]|jgi:3-methylfumaryl-CoA hydratase
MSDDSIGSLQNWVGRSQVVTDIISLPVIENMSATLGRDPGELKAGDPLPPSWHWLFFNRGPVPGNLRPDGHIASSNFVPPIPLPRRMWAGNKIDVTKVLTIGRPAECLTTIESIIEKEGSSGRLIFLEERSEVTDDYNGYLLDRKTIVYRAEANNNKFIKSNAAPVDSTWRQTLEPNSVLLFRYSALTFNSHRIHYDRDYTTEIEGYPALLVHGPLIATLLMNLLRQEMPRANVRNMNIRATAPIFVDGAFTVNGVPAKNGKSVELWATTGSGELAMTIDAELI